MAVLLIDNYDSFTYNIYHYILMCGQDCKLMRNTDPVMEEILEHQPEGIVFSPGPMRPENHPLMFNILERYYSSMPILGICLGHQAIGQFFGASLLKAPKPVHGKVSEISHTGHSMYSGIPGNVNVARYHSLALTNLEGTELITTATTIEGIPMSLAHKSLPVWGLQFHPEAIQTEYGLQMLKNWTSIFA